jgi:Domain of unknown function DUF29
MEELWELRRYLEASDVAGALALLDEMEAMAKDDKIDRMANYIQVLLVHLLKQAVEQRTTKSWQASIRNALYHICRTNKRRKVGGRYLTEAELGEIIEEVYDAALNWAAQEACEGLYTAEQLATMHERAQVVAAAFQRIQQAQTEEQRQGSRPGE